MAQMDRWIEQAKQVIDLTGDFRLDDTEVYQRYYGNVHSAPHLLGEGIGQPSGRDGPEGLAVV